MVKTIHAVLCILTTVLMLPACAQEVKIDETAFPESFVGTKENKIENTQALTLFYTKLKEGKDPVRVLHIGDSHVRGDFFPGNVRKALEVTFGTDAMEDLPIGYNKETIAKETGKPGIVFSSIGINGATTRNFMKPNMLDSVKKQKPDLLIVSFGTNEGYDSEYRAERHTGQLQRFIAALQEACGNNVEIILSTPPGCFKKGENKDQKIININNGVVSETIVKFAIENKLALWNMYEIVGGDDHACNNWKKAEFIQPDGVHFNKKGYELQGRLFGQAIAKGYLEFLKQ